MFLFNLNKSGEAVVYHSSYISHILAAEKFLAWFHSDSDFMETV